MKVKAYVDGLIKSNPVVLFEKGWCPYCQRAKQTLQSQFEPSQVKVLDLAKEEEGGAIQNYLAKLVNRSSVTVPRIYIAGNLIGGNDDLQALVAQKGEWEKIKASAAAAGSGSTSSQA